MTFVDEHERIYQNFAQYKKSNLLPNSFVIAPSNGIFNTDESGEWDEE